MPSSIEASTWTGPVRYPGAVAVCVLLAAALLACTGGDERVLELEAKARSLESSLEALADENAELKGEIAALRERLDNRDARLQELEEAASKAETDYPSKEQWSKDKDDLPSTAVERTARLVEESGGEVRYVDHPEREDSVLVVPLEFVDGETPAHRLPARLRRRFRLPVRLRAPPRAREQ